MVRQPFGCGPAIVSVHHYQFTIGMNTYRLKRAPGPHYGYNYKDSNCFFNDSGWAEPELKGIPSSLSFHIHDRALNTSVRLIAVQLSKFSLSDFQISQILGLVV